jgi:hypothetical protein
MNHNTQQASKLKQPDASITKGDVIFDQYAWRKELVIQRKPKALAHAMASTLLTMDVRT